MQATVLPPWVEYVKALGTPTVALIAALIAGALAYRQWTTARNKLKLDLFDKRMEIYSLSIDMLESVRSIDVPDPTAVDKLERKLHAARWLFNRDVELFLYKLTLATHEELKRRPTVKPEMTEEDLAKLLETDSRTGSFYQMSRQSLDKIFNPFLSLKH